MVRLLFILLLWAAPAFAVGYTVEWGYTPPSSPAVTGYRLYCNGIVVTDFAGASTESGVVTDGVLQIGDSFTLTALFDDSIESPHSAPYVWTGAAIAIRRFLTLKPTNRPGRTNGPRNVLIQ